MKLYTDAIFTSGRDVGAIDPRYTLDSDNSSPELRWTDVPEGTASLVLIAEDLDAKLRSQGGSSGAPDPMHPSPIAHWIVYSIPAGIQHLPAGIPPQDTLPNGIRQGINGMKKLGYTGPCPPSGDPPHRYVFRLYALNQLPEIPARATRDQILLAIGPHVIATAEVTGRYQRTLRETA